MNKKRKYIFLILLVININYILAIGFGHHIFEIRTSPEFSNGVFPTSLKYQFNFPVPNIISTSETEFALRLDNGIDFRTIKQDPITGNLMDLNPNLYSFPRKYMTFFNDFYFLFQQGFLNMPYTNKDLISANITIGGRFEKSYERLEYMNTPEEMEGLFYKSPDTPRFDNTVQWIGTPELQGDRNTFQFNISLGLKADYMQDKITRINGVRNTLWIRFTPAALQLQQNKLDFTLIQNKLELAYTLFSIKQNGDRDTTWLSMVLKNDTFYRCLIGSAIPYYAQNNSIWEAYAINTQHFISNRTALTIYGPQLYCYDVYPYITGFFDIGYNWGHLNNSNQNNITDLIMSTGFSVECNIFDIAKIYFEYGFIIDNTLDLEKSSVVNLGFSIGI